MMAGHPSILANDLGASFGGTTATLLSVLRSVFPARGGGIALRRLRSDAPPGVLGNERRVFDAIDAQIDADRAGVWGRAASGCGSAAPWRGDAGRGTTAAARVEPRAERRRRAPYPSARRFGTGGARRGRR